MSTRWFWWQNIVKCFTFVVRYTTCVVRCAVFVVTCAIFVAKCTTSVVMRCIRCHMYHICSTLVEFTTGIVKFITLIVECATFVVGRQSVQKPRCSHLSSKQNATHMLLFVTSLAFNSHPPVMYWNGKLDSVWSLVLPKIGIIRENISNKSCWALNAVQKSPWAHMAISSHSGVRGLEKLIWLRYYNAQKRQITFTSRPNAAKNAIIWKEGSIKSYSELNSLQKVSRRICLPLSRVELVGPKD